NGSGTGTLTYSWRISSQSPDSSTMAINLSSTNSANPTFNVPVPQGTAFGTSPQATFAVTANDGVATSTEATVTVRFFASLNNGTNSQTQNRVYSIVSTRCLSCHSGTNSSCPAGSGNNGTFYGMSTKTAFLNNSRGVTSCGSSSKSRLPSNGSTGQSTTNAFFWDRISGTSGGSQMPTSGGALSQADQLLIKDWIDQGVL